MTPCANCAKLRKTIANLKTKLAAAKKVVDATPQAQFQRKQKWKAWAERRKKKREAAPKEG